MLMLIFITPLLTARLGSPLPSSPLPSPPLHSSSEIVICFSAFYERKSQEKTFVFIMCTHFKEMSNGHTLQLRRLRYINYILTTYWLHTGCYSYDLPRGSESWHCPRIEPLCMRRWSDQFDYTDRRGWNSGEVELKRDERDEMERMKNTSQWWICHYRWYQ